MRVVPLAAPVLTASLLFGALALAGCGVPYFPVRVEAPEGYVLSFPGVSNKVIGHDGPVEFRVDAMRIVEGGSFESAWYRFPHALGPEEREGLMKRIERGLASGGARVASRVRTVQGPIDRLDVVFDHADGSRGHYRIFYTSMKSILRLSAVGPKGGDWEQLVQRFLESVELRSTGPIEDPKIEDPKVEASPR